MWKRELLACICLLYKALLLPSSVDNNKKPDNNTIDYTNTLSLIKAWIGTMLLVYNKFD